MKKPKATEFKFRKDQLKLFWFFLTERHSIWKKRFVDKKPWPWTDDEVLRDYKFTNVYRQLDRVTIEWQNRYAHLLAADKKILNSDIVFYNAMFRLFNWPETYDALFFGIKRKKWDFAQAVKILLIRQKEDFEQIFTGAYIVTSGGKSCPKVEVICDALDYIWKRKRQFTNAIRKGRPVLNEDKKVVGYEGATMEYAVELLQKIPTVGAFVAYELACDLRFTRVLSHAKDVMSWANPGPGAKRGIHRLLTGTHEKVPDVDYTAAMRQLLTTLPDDVRKSIKHSEWPFEMREIEHSLCEFDKMMRVRMGQGKPRSRYRQPSPQTEMPFGDEEE